MPDGRVPLERAGEPLALHRRCGFVGLEPACPHCRGQLLPLDGLGAPLRCRLCSRTKTMVRPLVVDLPW